MMLVGFSKLILQAGRYWQAGLMIGLPDLSGGYLPQSQRGSVLVATRSRSVALKLVKERDIIAVGPVDEAHAVALFERKLSTESDREDTVKLVAALEFMPLAVVQAAAYISLLENR